MRHLRIIILSAILSMVLAPARAQIGNLRGTFSMGVNGGASLSKMDIVPSLRQQFNVGKTFGVTLRYSSEKYFFFACSAQLECNYIERGWKELIEDGSGNQYRHTANYVEIPFMARLALGREFYGVQGFLEIGPQLGFLLSDREEKYGTEPWDISNRPASSKLTYGKMFENDFEYGIVGGAGIELKTRIGGFFLEGRYYFGLSDVYHNTKVESFARSANTSIVIKTGWIIDLVR